MLSKGKPARPEDCQVIEAATRGRVTRYQLRPDIFGKKPRKA
jgi:DNA-binding transcriptional regulator YdaS (Cro superfamily)